MLDSSFLRSVRLAPSHHNLLHQVVLLVENYSVTLSNQIVFLVAEQSSTMDELLSIIRCHLLLYVN